MIVPWPPGGVTDTLARFIADQLQRARQKLAAELQKIGQSAAFREKAQQMGAETAFLDGPQFAEFLRKEGQRLGEVVKLKFQLLCSHGDRSNCL